MSRVKKVLTGNVNRADAEEAFAAFSIADAKAAKINANIDLQFSKIREKYSTELTELNDEKEEAFEKLQNYAENNRDEFGNKKSLELTHGIIGFRTGTPKLKLLKGFTWNSVTNLLKNFLPTYVRVEEEPAKDRLLSDRDAPEVAAKLKDCGICVAQDESFYVEPKKEMELA